MVSDYDDPKSIGSRLRARRIEPLLEMIDAVYREKGGVSIVDVGGTEAYWRVVPPEFLDDHNVDITLVNLPGSFPPGRRGRFAHVEADGCHLACFADGSFDVAHSNSTIEHVGDRGRMSCFAHEIARLAPRYYVQTPDFWFPIEPHWMAPFVHWLPKSVRVLILRCVPVGHLTRATSKEKAIAAVESTELLDKRAVRRLFPGARIVTERFLGFPKSFVALKS